MVVAGFLTKDLFIDWRWGERYFMRNLIDGDLAKTTDYRAILAEILEKRCEAGSVADVFPGLSSDRPGVVNQRPA